MDCFMKKGTTILAGLAALGLAAQPALAGEEPSVEAAVGLYSKYIWRGFELSKDSLVIQPSLAVGYQGFSLGFWSNLDTDLHQELQSGTASRFQLNETDLSLTYGRSVGLAEFAAGYIYYSLDGALDSQEVFLSAGLDTFLSPTLTVYREIAHAPGWYANLSVSHSVPLTGSVALDLGASLGYLDDNGSSHFHDGLVSASVSYPLTERWTVTPELFYSFGLSGQGRDRIREASVSGKSDYVYGGVSLGLAF